MRHNQLSQFFKKNSKIAIAYSGGVDSSYLLYAAKAAKCNVRAYYIKTQFQPKKELDDAISFAAKCGVSLTVDALNALEDLNVANNAAGRCYNCKVHIINRLWELAKSDGFEVLCDGTNADDDEADRPGMKALQEYGVLSPLRECGLAKEDIRRLSKEAGLNTHDKPSYSCLATRIPQGTQLTVNLLGKIERAEGVLLDMGFSDLRVRFVPPSGAKIQLPDSQTDAAMGKRSEILAAFKPLFNAISLDLIGR
ncbi:MAG: ATP-dependent sacrificial sulfur transferase LarE [Oscillospiraceae bacterium]|nr:ATP-dependent sacrificial sulfur transferase LarE [Oscillospiraceae bacterium]